MTEVGGDVARLTEALTLSVTVCAGVVTGVVTGVVAGLGFVTSAFVVTDSGEVVTSATALLTATGFCSPVDFVPTSTGAVICLLTGAVVARTVCDESPRL